MKRMWPLLGALLVSAVSAVVSAPADDCWSLIKREPAFPAGGRVELHEPVPGNWVHVLLPVGFDRSGATRYPVLYLLHGATQDHNSWLDFGDILTFTKQAPGDVIVVLPAMNGLAIDVDHRNGTAQWETYFVEQLIPWVDATFPTFPDRSHRAVAGLSAVSALIIAGRHPDLFVAAGGFSAGAAFTPAAEFAVFERLIWACYGGSAGDDGVLGDPVENGIWYASVSPADLAPNYRGMTIYFSIGTGTPCDEEDVRELALPAVPAQYGVQHWGEAFLRTTQATFHNALAAEGIPHTWDAAGCGLHSWRYFRKGLQSFWPRMLAAFGSPPPLQFDFRTADSIEIRRTAAGVALLSNHEAWGWTFRADPQRAPEFLTVRNASRAGLDLHGSGVTSVTTAGYFLPSQVVGLSGAVESSVVADGEGRIAFHVDLGPPHQAAQYTIDAVLTEATATADYWTTRSITFTTAPTAGGRRLLATGV